MPMPSLAGNTVIKYAASKNPHFVADLTLTDTKAHWAAPFRKDEVRAARPRSTTC